VILFFLIKSASESVFQDRYLAGRTLKIIFITIFKTLQSASFGAGKTQDRCRQTAIGIKPAICRDEIDSRDFQGRYRLGFLGSDLPLEPDKRALGNQFAFYSPLVEIKCFSQDPGGPVGIRNYPGISGNRGGVNADRHFNVVCVIYGSTAAMFHQVPCVLISRFAGQP